MYPPELLADEAMSPTPASDMCVAPGLPALSQCLDVSICAMRASPRRYAYGLLLWCLFSGRPHAWADAEGRPPSAAAFTAITHRILTLGDRPDLAAPRPDTPAGVTALMRRCWAQVRNGM